MKGFLKWLARAFALLLTSWLWLPEVILKRALGREVLFASHLELLSLVPGKTGSVLRTSYLHATLDTPVHDCHILFGTVFTHSDATLGRNVYIGLRCCIGSAKIGSDTMLSDYVQVLSGRHQHGTDPGLGTFQQQSRTHEIITIGRNCWIGAGAIIMADVADNVVIGAGSIVVHPIPGDCVAVGSPAKPLKQLVPRSDAASTGDR